ncbi:MAG: hypothetical protein KC464_33700, partial [Myxococcales bacterium]|nr:hypothetical protein [Myxococcales bacterium]
VALGGAASGTPGKAPPPPCVFSPQLASEMLAVYPEADTDGDGRLTRHEACDFELALRRRWVDENVAATAEAPLASDERDRLALELSPRLVLGDGLAGVEELSCHRAPNEDMSSSPSVGRAALEPPQTCTQE